MFSLLCTAIFNKPNLDLFTRLHCNSGFGGQYLANLEGDTFFGILLVLMTTQPKYMHRLLFTSRSPLIRTITQEDTFYLHFDRLLSLAGIIADLVSAQCSCCIAKRFLAVIPILNTLAWAKEERIFNILNHLCNDPMLRMHCVIDFLPQDC